jgi:hypothetical protein
LAGSVIATDTIAETTAANGVDIDGLKVKDNTLTAWRYAVVTKSGNYNGDCRRFRHDLYRRGSRHRVHAPATIAGLRYGFVIGRRAVNRDGPV